MRQLVRGMLVAMSCWFSFLFGVIAFADSIDSFTIEIEPAQHQVDPSLKYFDLLLAPNQTETVAFHIRNKSEKKVPIDLTFSRAVNNANGVVIYSDSTKDTSETLSYNIEELVHLSDNHVELEPLETKTVYAKITMPKERFDGALAGGVYFKQSADPDFQGNVQSLFARELAILLRTKSDPIAPNIQINRAFSQQVNGRNAIALVVENPTPRYISKAQFSYQVLKDGQPLPFSNEQTITFAPNVTMEYMIALEGTEFESGTYQINTKIVFEGQEWQGSPTFTIDKKEASELNKADVSLPKKPVPLLTLVIGVIVLILLLIVVFQFIQNSRLKKEQTDE